MCEWTLRARENLDVDGVDVAPLWTLGCDDLGDLQKWCVAVDAMVAAVDCDATRARRAACVGGEGGCCAVS